MAHFAEIGLNNTVVRVVVVNNSELLDENGNEQEQKGVEFCRSLFGGDWVQTSYNSSFRKRFAVTGFTYDPTRDAFIPPRPYLSWKFDEASCEWVAPTPYPEAGGMYTWDESTQSWTEQ